MKRGGGRVAAGAIFWAFAGMSFTTGVLPSVSAMTLEMTSLDVHLRVGTFTTLMTLAWAAAGAVVGWVGGRGPSTLLLGGCGLLSGLALGGLGIGEGTAYLLVSGLAGLLYGGVGGLILGSVFPRK